VELGDSVGKLADHVIVALVVGYVVILALNGAESLIVLEGLTLTVPECDAVDVSVGMLTDTVAVSMMDNVCGMDLDVLSSIDLDVLSSIDVDVLFVVVFVQEV
jgi:hypothetical protein